VATAATPAPTVQWDVSTDGGATFTSIPDATSDTYSFVATATQDGDEYEAVLTSPSGSLTTTVATLDVFAITTLSLPEATRGIAYRVHLDAIGGLSPYTWACTGALPKGLALTADGLLSGRPKVKNVKPATYTVTVTATMSPSSGQPRLTATQTLTLTLL
jgi:hypothetical protein